MVSTLFYSPQIPGISNRDRIRKSLLPHRFRCRRQHLHTQYIDPKPSPPVYRLPGYIPALNCTRCMIIHSGLTDWQSKVTQRYIHITFVQHLLLIFTHMYIPCMYDLPICDSVSGPPVTGRVKKTDSPEHGKVAKLAKPIKLPRPHLSSSHAHFPRFSPCCLLDTTLPCVSAGLAFLISSWRPSQGSLFIAQAVRGLYIGSRLKLNLPTLAQSR